MALELINSTIHIVYNIYDLYNTINDNNNELNVLYLKIKSLEIPLNYLSNQLNLVDSLIYETIKQLNNKLTQINQFLHKYKNKSLYRTIKTIIFAKSFTDRLNKESLQLDQWIQILNLSINIETNVTLKGLYNNDKLNSINSSKENITTDLIIDNFQYNDPNPININNDDKTTSHSIVNTPTNSSKKNITINKSPNKNITIQRNDIDRLAQPKGITKVTNVECNIKNSITDSSKNNNPKLSDKHLQIYRDKLFKHKNS